MQSSELCKLRWRCNHPLFASSKFSALSHSRVNCPFFVTFSISSFYFSLSFFELRSSLSRLPISFISFPPLSLHHSCSTSSLRFTFSFFLFLASYHVRINNRVITSVSFHSQQKSRLCFPFVSFTYLHSKGDIIEFSAAQF